MRRTTEEMQEGIEEEEEEEEEFYEFNCLSLCVKGYIRTISPGRIRFDFQILAYLVTIQLLYALDAYHIDSVNTCYD